MAGEHPCCPTTGVAMPEQKEDGLDPVAVLARVGGDPSLLAELVDMFMEDSGKLLAEIGDAVRQGNARELKFAAHLLRGLIGNFATSAAYEAARRLELLAGAGDVEGAASAYRTLDQEVCRFRTSLAQIRPESISRVTMGPPGASSDPERGQQAPEREIPPWKS